MSQYLIGVTHKEFNSVGGYADLSASVIASAVKDWQKDKFDVFKWLENKGSDKWFDYLGLNKGYFEEKLKGIQLEGSGIIRRDFG